VIFFMLIAAPAVAVRNKPGKPDNPGGDNCHKTKTCDAPTPTPTPTPTTAPDAQPPTTTIVAPSDNAKVSGTVKVTGTAADNVGVAEVEVAVGGTGFTAANGTTSWALPVDTTALSDGSHTVTARATDQAGNTSTSQIAIDVNNAPAPDPGGGGSGGSSGPCDKSLTGPASIQTALNSLSTGQQLCLSGTFTVTTPIHPKAGQTISGPATIVGQGMTNVQDVFAVKTGPGAGAVNVTFRGLDISGAGRRGIGCWLGTTIIGGRLHHNGMNGTGCDLEGRTTAVVVDGVEIDHNGTDPANLGCCAGGIKWFHANGVTVRNSFVHDNTGNGVWCDAQCGDFTVSDNTIVRNTRKGVFYEKGGASDGSFLGRTWAVYVGQARIVNNVIRDNDLEGVPQAHAGVSIYSAKNAYVAGNTFGGNGNAVIAREDTLRLTDDKHGWHLSNIVIENNTLNGDDVIGCASDGVTCSSNT